MTTSQKRKRKAPSSPPVRVVGNRGKNDGCCSISFLKNLLYIFNFILLLSGIAILGIGIWTIFAKSSFVSLLTTSCYQATTYLLIATGSLIVFLVIVLGCCGVWKENIACLNVFAAFLMLIFLLEAGTGILATLYETAVKDEISRNLNYTMMTAYKKDAKKTQAIDSLHKTFKCCGAGSFEDWPYSNWLANKTNIRNIAPDSCCITVSPGCAVRAHPSNIYYMGCMDSLQDFLREHLIILGAVGIGLCSLQIFGIIFACCLVKKLKEWHERQKTSYWR